MANVFASDGFDTAELYINQSTVSLKTEDAEIEVLIDDIITPLENHGDQTTVSGVSFVLVARDGYCDINVYYQNDRGDKNSFYWQLPLSELCGKS